MDEFYSCSGHGLSRNLDTTVLFGARLFAASHTPSLPVSMQLPRNCASPSIFWSPPHVVPRPTCQWISYTSAGYAAPSFAVHCAAMAGVPPQILERAAQVTRAHIQVWGLLPMLCCQLLDMYSSCNYADMPWQCTHASPVAGGGHCNWQQ